ncbi:hypothetical protein [Kribbella swartbergensis]
MSFRDLPQTWTDQPLSDPTVAADVVDLLVSLGDRRRGTFTVVLCDANTHYRAAIAIDLPSQPDHPTYSPAADLPSESESEHRTRSLATAGLPSESGHRPHSLATAGLPSESEHTRSLAASDLPSGFERIPSPASGDPTSGFGPSTRSPASGDLPSEFGHSMRSLAAGDVCTSTLTPFMPAVRTAPGTTLLLALGRPGPPTWPSLDNEWASAATHTCRAAGVPLLGFYIATAHHIYQPLQTTQAVA